MSIKKEQEIVLFFIYLSGDIMLFIKGFIVGLGKIIPGVSGALLAINFNVYERLFNSLTNFIDDWKNNSKFLITFGLGAISAIVLCSKVILFLLTNYKFVTLMFFIGLIIGGTYNFSKNIKYNYKNILIVLLISIFFLFISINSFNNTYSLKDNFIDNIIFFIGGIIEIFASIVPGISGTSLLMMMGIYNQILYMISKMFNFSYVLDYLNIYISYGIGMGLSFIINAYLISYLLKKYRNQSNTIILGLSLSSIIYLLIIVVNIKIKVIEFILGIMLLVLGILISSILDK